MIVWCMVTARPEEVYMTCIGVCILDLLEEWRDTKQEDNITHALLARCQRLVFLYAHTAMLLCILTQSTKTPRMTVLAESPAALSSIGGHDVMFVDTGI